MCVYVCWSTSTCISTKVKMNSEAKKNLTGFFKKNSHPQETTEIPCLPPQPPTSMLWSEVPNIINRNGCFFWRPPNTKFRRQHWIGGRGRHDLCGVVLHGMAVFFEEPGLRKDTIGWTHGCRQTREWWRHCVRESIGISLGGCLCVWVCLFACAGACVLIWVVLSEIHAATVLTPFWPDSAMSLGALAVVLRGRRAPLRAWLLYPAHLPCNAHATHMQHTCNTHATHMQHDMQHEFFTCNFTVNVQDLTFAAPTPVLEWKV